MSGLVVALAGRRIDAFGAPSRFPLDNASAVRGRLTDLLRDRGAEALVCSAACGADLLALAAAGSLGLRRRVVLPFDPQRFRETSVTDRPGEWGPLYDQVIDATAGADDLVVLERAGPEDDAYAAVSRAILEEALRIVGFGGSKPAGERSERSANADVLAVIVWDGRSRGPGDLTALFAEAARENNLEVFEVSTLESES